MGLKDAIAENETLKKAWEWFLKIGTGSFLIYGSFLIAQKILGFTFDLSVSLGL